MPQDEGHGGAPSEAPVSQRLTNDDFRRLLMTPRSTPAAAPAVGSIREAMNHSVSMAPPKSEDRSELRRKKKSYYAKLKKQEDDKMAELAEKYRDRARERRDGRNPDYQNEDPLSTASAYRAVAPDLKSGMDAAERRRQMIQESKYLGGDMEHTHLVKGLDYALLQKVRSEIIVKENEQEQQMEELAIKSMEEETIKEKEKDNKKNFERDDDEMQFNTKLGRNIHRTVCALKSRHIERSDLFVPGRMAYVIDLEEEGDTDIPTTLIRSKSDIPAFQSTPTLTTNDIVINKLAQILTYLRQGNRHKNKKGKKDKITGPPGQRYDDGNDDQPTRRSNVDDSIYGDIGDYVPSRRESSRDHHRDHRSDKDRGRDRDRGRHEKNSYFDKSLDDEQSSSNINSSAQSSGTINVPQPSSRSQKLLNRLAQEPEGYAECYPGLDEMQDAIDDSDDEVDYTKMDLGNKKGPIGRWDFDTQEEYSDYMNNKEALPKAAFQYGVKMADGRRTRKNKDKNEKAVLDREWQQIQNIIQKRKGPKEDGRGDFKMPRY